MPGEAPLEQAASGLAPAGDGWFVVNARDAAWATNDAFGSRCVFEASPRVLPDRPELHRRFEQVGINLDVIAPGQASGLYHAEGDQEDFLVLQGECVLLIDGEERPLRAWDFVHCPPGTEHVFVGAGDGPCVIFMVGGRGPAKELRYPRSELALARGAGVETETTSAREAYDPFPRWRPERPASWDDLPWTS
ncbi:MAG TPA: cupin domain-containing protein [Gaiellaceae bacterium]|nr:cupin domain-containing protein [Gaiellaceae bacterium]